VSLVPSSLPTDWRVPLFAGGASIPFTLVSYQQSGSTMSLSAVVFAGLAVGLWTGGADRVGARTGLVGGLAVLWPVAETVALVPALSGPPTFLVAAALGAVVFGVLGLALSTILDELGARVGGWLARHSGRRFPATDG
jgi:hypothetical protein